MEKSIEEMSIEMPSSSETQSTSVCLEPMGRWEDFLSEWKEKKEAGKTASIVKSFKEKKIVNRLQRNECHEIKEKKIVNKLQRNERQEKARKLKKKNEIVNKEHAGNACNIVNKNISNENVESGKLPLTPTPLGKKVEESGKGSREKGQPKKEPEHKQKSSTDYMEKSIAEIPIWKKEAMDNILALVCQNCRHLDVDCQCQMPTLEKQES